MATTKTKTADKTAAPNQDAPQQQPPAQLPATMALRLPYPKSMKEWMGYDERDWQVLTDVIFPLATTVGAIVLAVEYCRARKLDIFKKVIHIVPMRRKIAGTDKYEMVDTIWPGIAEVRITATRTGIYAGKDAAVFGPTLTEKFQYVDNRNDEVKKEEDISFPEWCRVDVYKIIQGQRCKFEGPKVYWKEAYASESFFSDIPNEMWKTRSSGQLEKCAEAAALRAAFPEELGGEYTAEEMHGRTIEGNQVSPGHYEMQGSTMVPPRPQQSDFARKPDPKKPDAGAAPTPQPIVQEPEPEPSRQPDGRPEPPPIDGDYEEVHQPSTQTAPPIRAPEEDEQSPSEAYMEASNWLDELEARIANEKDLEALKKVGRTQIDGITGISDDERDMIRGRFTTMVLTEQRRRAGRAR